MPQPTMFSGDPFGASLNLKKASEDKAAATERNRIGQDALSLHLAKLEGRAAELNAVPAPEVPFTTDQGTGETVALDQPLPPRNPHIGGMMPLDQPGALELRGYLTPDGKSTPSGRLFLELEKQGLFDKKGLLTDKGRAFVADPDPRAQDLVNRVFVAVIPSREA